MRTVGKGSVGAEERAKRRRGGPRLIAGTIAETLPFSGGRHGSPGGTDTSRHYPALWAIGLAANIVGVPLAKSFVRVYDRPFPSRPAPQRTAGVPPPEAAFERVAPLGHRGV